MVKTMQFQCDRIKLLSNAHRTILSYLCSLESTLTECLSSRKKVGDKPLDKPRLRSRNISEDVGAI